MYVCLCFMVKDTQVRDAVSSGARDVAAVGRLTAAGTDCGTCRERLVGLIEELTGTDPEETG